MNATDEDLMTFVFRTSDTDSKSHTAARNGLDGHSTDPPFICMLAIDGVTRINCNVLDPTIPVLIEVRRNDHRTHHKGIYVTHNNVTHGCE